MKTVERAFIILVSLCSILSANILLAAENPSQVPQPAIQMENTRYDFGMAGRQETISHIFEFQNVGDEDLLIESVKATCGCVAELLSSPKIPPGASGSIRVSVETGVFPGPRNESILVKTNDPHKPEIELKVTGSVKTGIGVMPEFVHFGEIPKGQMVSRTIQLLQLSDAPLELKRIDASSPQLTVTYDPFHRAEGQQRPGYEITVRLNATELPAGPLAEVITLATNSPDQPRIDVPVSGTVRNSPPASVADATSFSGTLVFLANRDGNWDIFLWDNSSEPPVRLTQTPYDEKFPALAPAKDQLVYTTTEGRPYLLDLKSRETRPLAIQGLTGKWDQCSFASDARHVICTFLDPAEQDRTALAMIDRDTGKASLVLDQFGPQFAPAWAPTGSEMAYAYAHCSSACGRIIQEIWLADLTQREARQATLTNAHCLKPSWSPDGATILFAADIQDNFDIWRLDLRTKALTRLTDYPGLDESPAYGPDGDHFAFISTRSGQSGLWVKTLSSGQLTELKPFGAERIEIKDVTWR